MKRKQLRDYYDETPEGNRGNDYYRQISLVGEMLYKGWLLLPYILVGWLCYKMLGCDVILKKILLEITCGKNCSCLCDNENSNSQDRPNGKENTKSGF